ncbi:MULTISPECIES: high-affinity branched-chain amino acid ABC transporter permease LivM [Burkholderia]|uniref:High-affinity branched-chain amino acid ABC transporter permease LivM n=2 Tax=Burkholderia TaxID=32008 RepID=A0A365QYR0_9BURK|nr:MULTISPECIES: high-affinity branched-chain amino acid ABC transporter permease LivM [Burkholderia]HDR9756042.1 high-affinity branched-chain amino acid ABC transporter permease LivM [Burkholderia cepacia ATCC 25416]KUY72308.1 branched-chain amino acid ABC transporter permease [Burkholderia cepacia]KVA50298.1 branched-chain amino acid ABC transporter permease [Burkholderia cepacia]KVA53811.1 branched-chain amino acid ABC transporter permease [Burkholderia cepacia]KVA59403.1 branched-chain ami
MSTVISVRRPAADASIGQALKNAVAAAFLTAILTIPVLGLQLKLDGYQVVLTPHWRPVWIAVAAVFLFQLFKPWLVRAKSAVKLPAMPAMGARQQRAVVWVLLAVGLVWPFFGSRGAVDVATLALIYVILGLGLNIVVGFAGLLDLGYVGFYAVGGYTYAMLNQYFGLSFWECLPLAAIAAATFGFLLGFPVLRLRGDYLAIVTLGFGEIIRLLANNLTSLTGGPDGISGIPKPTVFGYEMARSASVEGAKTFHELIGLEYSGDHVVIFLYLLALVLVGFTLFVTSRLIRMPMGRAWEALRDDEIACRSLGLNPTRIKLSAFTLGAAFAGIGGAFFAARQGLVNPESFTFIESALILAIVVLGGMGSQLGVILAAILLTVLPEVARGFAEYRMLIFGLVMVLMMMWRPQGLLPASRPHVELPR